MQRTPIQGEVTNVAYLIGVKVGDEPYKFLHSLRVGGRMFTSPLRSHAQLFACEQIVLRYQLYIATRMRERYGNEAHVAVLECRPDDFHLGKRFADAKVMPKRPRELKPTTLVDWRGGKAWG